MQIFEAPIAPPTALLAQEVAEVARLAVTQHHVPQGLEQDRARTVHAQGGLALEVDAPVDVVGEGAHRAGQVLHVLEGEAVVGGDRQDLPLGEGPGGVVDGAQGLGGRLLDVLEVVAALAHLAPQVGVGPTGLLGGGRRLGAAPLEFVVQAHDVFEHVVGHPLADLQVRQVQLLVEGVALGLLDGDLQLRPAAGGLLGQQLLHRDPQGRGQGREEGQLGFTFPVLQQGELRGRPADAFTQVGEGETARPPQMPEPLPEGNEI